MILQVKGHHIHYISVSKVSDYVVTTPSMLMSAHGGENMLEGQI